MKRLCVLLMTVLATTMLMSVSFAGERTISVTGDAEVLVPPDQVIIRLAVITKTMDLLEAQKKNDGLVDKVLESIKKHGVEPAHIQTSHGSLRPQYEDLRQPDGSRTQKFVGYSADKSVVVTLKKISVFSEVLSAALNAGANRFDGIHFLTSELRKHRDQARTMAVKAAREKAELLAGQLWARRSENRPRSGRITLEDPTEGSRAGMIMGLPRI
ncbi:MAG: SIMPL domain-containing protein [Thermodesulfobacteriota bacterium]